MSSESLQEIVCCMGMPVAGNPTQYMMEKAFAAAGLDWRYLTLEVPPENLVPAIGGLRAMGFRGGNLTIPHKVAAVAQMDELSEAARQIGAINCIHIHDGRLVGENTDGKGFLESLIPLRNPHGLTVEVLGAGGAARAIAVELALAGAAEIRIVNRSERRGQELADELARLSGELAQLSKERPGFACQFVPWNGQRRVPEETDLVVQATSIGLGDSAAQVPVNLQELGPDTIAADVVFNPSNTQFLQAAQSAGLQTLDGLGMLVNQAVISFQIWTGIEPDRQVMRDALEEFLGF